MFGLIKLITVLILLTGVTVYGSDIWGGIKQKVAEFTNPELQKANLFDSLRNNFSRIESIVNEVNENIDNPDFDKKAKLEEGLSIIKETRSGLDKIGQSDSSLVEKTFENLRELKDGIKALISPASEKESQECRCSLEE